MYFSYPLSSVFCETKSCPLPIHGLFHFLPLTVFDLVLMLLLPFSNILNQRPDDHQHHPSTMLPHRECLPHCHISPLTLPGLPPIAPGPGRFSGPRPRQLWPRRPAQQTRQLLPPLKMPWTTLTLSSPPLGCNSLWGLKKHSFAKQ